MTNSRSFVGNLFMVDFINNNAGIVERTETTAHSRSYNTKPWKLRMNLILQSSRKFLQSPLITPLSNPEPP